MNEVTMKVGQLISKNLSRQRYHLKRLTTNQYIEMTQLTNKFSYFNVCKKLISPFTLLIDYKLQDEKVSNNYFIISI